MPKVKAKSVGRKFKRSNDNQAQIPPAGSDTISPQSTEDIEELQTTTEVEMENLDTSNFEEMEVIEATGIRIYENSSLAVDVNLSSGADVQPGPSGLQTNAIANPADTTEEQIPEETVAEPFEMTRNDRMQLLLSNRERRTLKAFKEHHIEEQYEYPVENESKDDTLIRKHRNAAKLHAARNRQYRNPEDEQLS